MTAKTKKPARGKRDPKYPPCLGPEALRKIVLASGVRPIQSVADLVADFWPEDESADDVIGGIRRWRHEGLDRHSRKMKRLLGP